MTNGGLRLRAALPEEHDAVAAVFRISKESALPYLPDLHTPEEDRTFFRERVFAACEVWVAERDGETVGFCAFRDGWIDHLYVHPGHQRAGVGTALLHEAMKRNAELRLWTFQRNVNARRFYESHGFVAERTTAGENEELEPDVLYRWTAPLASAARLD